MTAAMMDDSTLPVPIPIGAGGKPGLDPRPARRYPRGRNLVTKAEEPAHPPCLSARRAALHAHAVGHQPRGIAPARPQGGDRLGALYARDRARGGAPAARRVVLALQAYEIMDQVSDLETAPCENLAENVRLHYKRLIGEAIARNFDDQYDSARRMLGIARTYFRARSEETSRKWYLIASYKAAGPAFLLGVIPLARPKLCDIDSWPRCIPCCARSRCRCDGRLAFRHYPIGHPSV
jgi:hypothetical protein